METYALTVTEFGVNVVDQDGKQLSSDEIKGLAEKLLMMIEPQPIASLYLTNGVPDQLVLFDGKRRKKSPEKTEDEKRMCKRTNEIKTLYAKLRALTMQQIALPMDDLMALLPGGVCAEIDYGREGQSAKKLARDPRIVTDRQIVGCYKWLSTAREHQFFFKSKSPSLHDVLGRMDKYLSLIPSAKIHVDTKRQAAYKSIEMDVSF